MKLDKVRQDTLKLFEQVRPNYHSHVFEPDAWDAFSKPTRARNLAKLHKFELSRGILFCRACITRHPTKNYIFAHKLWIELSDNLLENRTDGWVSIQCCNDDCDFDLLTEAGNLPRNVDDDIELLTAIQKFNRENPELIAQKALQEKLAEWRALSSAPTLSEKVRTTKLHDHQADALSYIRPQRRKKW